MRTAKSKSDVIFLFGAGASVEAGVRTSDDITDIIVNYGSYCPSKNSTAIENLLRYIQVRIADYLQVKASEVNFEHILGTLTELSRRAEYPIVPFLGEGDSIVRKIEKTISIQEVIDKLYALLRELFFVRNPVDYLNPLKTFLSYSKPLELFTLNYDTAVETAFSNNGVSFTTGYRQRSKGLPIWDAAQFDKKSFDVRIIKLHGSVNWGHHFFYPPPPVYSEPTSEVSLATDHYLSHYPERIEFNPFPIGIVEPPDRKIGVVSIMNFGTRKELLYAESIFTVLFKHFLDALKRAKVCIICGYSFRDERINKLLEEAVVSRKGELHLIVVDPSVFPVRFESTILRKFMEWEWATPLKMKLGDSLKDGALLETLRSNFGERNLSKTIGQTVPIYGHDDHEDKGEPNTDRILHSWRILGISFDLTYFWMSCLSPELKEFEHCGDGADIARVGHILLPLNRKVRDLCFHIRSVYEAMQLNGAYGGSYLETIKVSPKFVSDFSHMDLVRKWLPRLGSAVSTAFHAYNRREEEFRRAITDPDFGKKIDAPSNLSAAELVIRHDIGYTYELVCILNDIYKGAGYEEPFKMIREDYCKSGG